MVSPGTTTCFTASSKLRYLPAATPARMAVPRHTASGDCIKCKRRDDRTGSQLQTETRTSTTARHVNVVIRPDHALQQIRHGCKLASNAFENPFVDVSTTGGRTNSKDYSRRMRIEIRVAGAGQMRSDTETGWSLGCVSLQCGTEFVDRRASQLLFRMKQVEKPFHHDSGREECNGYEAVGYDMAIGIQIGR